MDQSEGPLPDFENPPVSEVALSAEFPPLENWNLSFVLAYWQSISTDYPNASLQPELPRTIERFGETAAQPPPILRFAPPDSQRYWFSGTSPQDLIQLQRDRFIVNWRKVVGDEKYPRYGKAVRPRFEREWHRFRTFLSSRDMPLPAVQQCEVTYVNDIPRSDGWDSVQDLGRVLSLWSGKGSGGYLPSLEEFALHTSFLMEPNRGRLYAMVQHLRRAIDKAEVIQLQLIARYQLEGAGELDPINSIDRCHEWIVRAFADFTTPEAHRIWKRIR